MEVFTKQFNQDVFIRKFGMMASEVNWLHGKSAEGGVHPDVNKVRFRVQGRMLERLLQKHQNFIHLIARYSKHVFDSFFFPHLFIITDSNGVVLYIEGDEMSMANAEIMHNIGVGSSLSMNSAGTNPVSTAMAVKRPVYLQGDQHYLEGMKDWLGMSIPLFSEHEPMAYSYFACGKDLPGSFIYPCIETLAGNLQNEVNKLELQNKSWFMEETLEKNLKAYKLTEREQDIAKYWMLDYDYKQISKVLGISENTVRVYVSKINNKMKVNSKASLILRILGAI
ncbi:helix-turn-helix transcriptional regulator [Marinicrinis sediminis]|uniref:LuxR C-terminal-related transcriptional regulator n=1 Tax=Marinicrinis sediminis TaxID=1652465 RepID=A0ABW5RC22_9BACL